MDEEIIIRRDGSVTVLGIGYYYEETVIEIPEAARIMEIAGLCDQIGKYIAKHRGQREAE